MNRKASNDDDAGDRRRAAQGGLCGDCLHARPIRNRRGSVFLHCQHPDLPRYPPQPVTTCAGHVARERHGRALQPDGEEEVALDDGTRLVLRFLRRSDTELLRRGLRELSSASRYARFLGTALELDEETLDRLVDVDDRDRVAIGAVELDPIGRERGVGLARFARLPGEAGAAEAAIAVLDAFQGRGLGRLLLERLVGVARARDVHRFHAEVLASNDRMRTLLDDLGAPVPDEPDERGILPVRIPLDEEPSPASDAAPTSSLGRRLLRAAAHWIHGEAAPRGVGASEPPSDGDGER